MAKTQKSVTEFAMIGFVLLAVLFGMQIMTFIFGSLASADFLDDVAQTTTNETEAWLNITPYTIDKASDSDFSGFVITALWNGTDAGVPGGYNVSIPLGNATSVSGSGTFTSTGLLYNSTNVSVSYTSTHKTEAEMVSDETTNSSLHAIGDYTEQSGTQFTTLGIAITLVILVAVFLFFWVAFMGKGKGKGEGPGGFS